MFSSLFACVVFKPKKNIEMSPVVANHLTWLPPFSAGASVVVFKVDLQGETLSFLKSLQIF